MATIESKLPLVPRYRQKVRFVPLDLGAPASGSTTRTSTSTTTCAARRCRARAATRSCASSSGRVMSQQLDRHKPLWEMWMVEGLERGALGAALEDPPLHGRRRVGHRPDDACCSTPSATRPRPDARAVGARARAEHARRSSRARSARAPTSPYEAARSAWAAVRGPRRAARGAADLARAASSLRNLLRPTSGVVAQRPDRPAPPLGLGAQPARRTSRRSAPRSAARSTTSCSP